jgi:hypothetical protein
MMACALVAQRTTPARVWPVRLDEDGKFRPWVVTGGKEMANDPTVLAQPDQPSRLQPRVYLCIRAPHMYPASNVRLRAGGRIVAYDEP